MAATRLIALHINKGKTVAQCLADRTDYSENAAKTEDGKYISAYACDAKTCDEEFLLSKRQYEHITGRTQAHDVIAYQIRQSFKPGEITPEEANKVGYETAMRFTKGKHAFIVATHVDRAHISIRNNELYTKEWQCRISIPTQSPTYLAKTAFALFAKNYQWEHPIRSVTVRAINLFEEDCPIQYDLFTDMKSLDRQERLDAAIEQIRLRFGKDAIKNGVLFQKSKMPTERKVDLVMPTGMIG